ncbi:MAG: hypothetical protein OXC46_04620, partial [Thaumarchaeota archaeon]|nr:hypothetical protein [Nitrososphaerota archaeon]
MLLTYSGAVQESFANTGVGFIKRGSIVDDAGTTSTRLGDVKDMHHFTVGQTNYIAVSSSEGIHLVAVDNTGSPSAATATGGAWGSVINIVMYESTSSTRIVGLYESAAGVITTGTEGAIQTFSISGNQVSRISASALISAELAIPVGLEIYSPQTGKHYAVTTSGVTQNKSYVHIIDITDPSTAAEITATITDTTNLSLRGPSDVDIYTTNNKYYAVVTSYYEHAVTILDITSPNVITHVATLSDNTDRLLNSAEEIEIYSTGGKHYAVVIPRVNTEAGIQILDITDPTNPTAVGKLQVANNNNLYSQAIALTLHTYNDRWYALLIGKDGHNSLQIIDITDPSAPEASSHIRPANTNEKITSVESYAIGERQFASVGTTRIDNTNPLPGLDILEMAFLTSNAGPNQSRTHGQTVTLNGAAAVTV